MSERPKILVVDDSESNLFLLEEVLKEFNYRVAKAKSGKEALEKIYQERPDLVLLDIMMPETSGFHVLEHLKQSNNKIPIIILSARSSEQDMQKAFSLGARLFIKKPVIITNILAKIEEILLEHKN